MNDFVQKIFDLYAEILPEDWQKFILHAAIAPGQQSMYFFVRVKGEQKYWSYDELEEIGLFTEDEFRAVRLKAGKESFLFQKKANPVWTGYTLSIDDEGNADIDFEYDEQPVMIPDTWKTKYLK